MVLERKPYTLNFKPETIFVNLQTQLLDENDR
jgi:hypothetical protein